MTHMVFCLNIPQKCHKYYQAITPVTASILFLNFNVLKAFALQMHAKNNF